MAVRRAHAAGYNTLLVQVRGRGDAWYRSPYEPWPDPVDRALEPTYDPLGTVLQEAQALGLRVHAWLNLHLVASALLPPRDPAHLFHRSPEVLAVPRELAPRLWGMSPRDPRYREALLEWTRGAGDRVEGIYTNPAHPEVRMHLAALVRDLVERYPLDGIHFDYVRYPGPEFDYSRTSLEAFRGWMRGERGHLPDRMHPGGGMGPGIPSSESGEGTPRSAPDPARLLRAEGEWGTNPFAYATLFPDEWAAFRRGQITAALETLYWTVKERRPEMLVSAAVFANADDAIRGRYQEWERWLSAGILEVAVLMAYTTSDDTFRSQIARATRAAGGDRVWAGVGSYTNSLAGAVRKGRIARELGTGGVALFSYDWMVGPEGVRAAGGEYLGRYVGEVWGR